MHRGFHVSGLMICGILSGLTDLETSAQPPQQLPDTSPLQLDEPLDVVMVRGISRFAERELAGLRAEREIRRSADGYDVELQRAAFRELIGVVDERTTAGQEPYYPFHAGRETADTALIMPVRWPVLEGVSGEGLVLLPQGDIRAFVIAIPDAETTAEQFITADGELDFDSLPLRLLHAGCAVLIPTLIDRRADLSGHPDIRYTNIPHREFVYRMAFELGRHVIGYEVQRILAAVDLVDARHRASGQSIPIGVCGYSDGGLLALYAAAIDPRIDVCWTSGYFDDRTNVWQEPIDRNVWRLNTAFADADLARMILPRQLVIETAAVPEITGPPAAGNGRGDCAAPGRIAPHVSDKAAEEIEVAVHFFAAADAGDAIATSESPSPGGPAATQQFLRFLGIPNARSPFDGVNSLIADDADARHRRQFDELVRFTQMILHRSDKVRAKRWADADRSSVDAWVSSAESYRELVHDEMIGRLPVPDSPLNVRSRLVIDEPSHTGYEIVLDVIPSADADDAGVIAGGILLLPKDLQPGERRPVVVCQHGLEGTPMDTITTDESARAWAPYKGFSTQLVQRGFIVYAPQNPYRGYHDFRVIQRKSNPAGRSLFSYIIEQHRRTLQWLASLPHVDADRIAFYGLSYGGKTAVRVPPLLPPSPDSPGYCLSICSADFNEWIRKNVSSEDRYSYVFTPEYEMFEWNMGHVAGYAELSTLMTPRPFMVERGHNDGVAPDEWVAWEFAKVRRHYDQLGIGQLTEIEWFNGPHTINGQGTFDFLQKHLNE